MTTITSILTQDILPKIFQFLSDMEIGRFSQTSKAAHKAIAAIPQEPNQEIGRPLQGITSLELEGETIVGFDRSQKTQRSLRLALLALGQIPLLADCPRRPLTDEQRIMLRLPPPSFYANLGRALNTPQAPGDDDNS